MENNKFQSFWQLPIFHRKQSKIEVAKEPEGFKKNYRHTLVTVSKCHETFKYYQ